MNDQASIRLRRRTLNRFFFDDNGNWFVQAREGVQGPFTRREEAVAYLERHKRLSRRSRSDRA